MVLGLRIAAVVHPAAWAPGGGLGDGGLDEVHLIAGASSGLDQCGLMVTLTAKRGITFEVAASCVALAELPVTLLDPTEAGERLVIRGQR